MAFSPTTKKITLALAAAGLVSVSAFALRQADDKPVAAAPPAAAAASAADLPDLTGLVAQATPSVVHITVSRKGGEQFARGLPEFPEDSPFGEFFKRFPRPGPESAPSQGMGSGFIVSADGYVVTNHHVIDGADKVTVKLHDRREFPAKVVGSDKQSDVALLKIEATGLPAVKLGNSDALKVGQWVLAIGAPFGLERSATQGIVSALGRSLPDERYVPFIQTDVAVNPGNSGGPLFDLSGRVVGINSQIYSQTGGYMGLSFAIPINTAMDVVHQIKAGGKVARGWLGLTVQPVTQDLASSFGVGQPKGALVSQVAPGSPAAEAGFRVGDIVTGFAGKAVEDSADLPPMVGTTRPGEKVAVNVLRDGKERSLEVKIAQLPDTDGKVRIGQAETGEGARLNVTVAELSAEERRALGVDGGVRVAEVGAGAARQAGVRPGDVLLQIDNQPVKDVAQLKELVRGLPAGKTVPILVKRGEGALFLALGVPASRG
jgi:serine protease Do